MVNPDAAPMRDLHLMDLTDLMDLLSEQTSAYTKLLLSGESTEQLAKCRLLTTKIQLEIEQRRKKYPINVVDILRDSYPNANHLTQ
jgi:hypothetical protein